MNSKQIPGLNSALSVRGASYLVLTAIVFIVFAALQYSSSGPLPTDVNQAIEGLQKRYEKIKTCKVNFHQSLTSAAFRKVIREADGVIYYTKPGKIRWEYKAPEERLYLIDGEMFWDYEPKAKQVLKLPVSVALAGDVPQGFLFGAGNLRKDFQITLITDPPPAPTEKGYRLSLNPKDPDLRAAISNLVLVVNSTDYSVTASSFTDVQGNINNYTFSNIVDNPALDPEMFRFKIPRGVKVIVPATEVEKKKHK